MPQRSPKGCLLAPADTREALGFGLDPLTNCFRMYLTVHPKDPGHPAHQARGLPTSGTQASSAQTLCSTPDPSKGCRSEPLHRFGPRPLASGWKMCRSSLASSPCVVCVRLQLRLPGHPSSFTLDTLREKGMCCCPPRKGTPKKLPWPKMDALLYTDEFTL